MNTANFLESLTAKDATSSLIFQIGDKPITPGYHVTEIKAAGIQTVDCGGQTGSWQETTFQLWSPEHNENTEHSDNSYMTVGKFLSIYNRVSSNISISDSATVRIEYGDPGSAAVSYLVEGLETAGERVMVSLQAPAVACKDADRSVGDIPVLSSSSAACCSPAPSSKETLTAQASGACCG